MYKIYIIYITYFLKDTVSSGQYENTYKSKYSDKWEITKHKYHISL